MFIKKSLCESLLKFYTQTCIVHQLSGAFGKSTGVNNRHALGGERMRIRDHRGYFYVCVQACKHETKVCVQEMKYKKESRAGLVLIKFSGGS